MNKAFTLIELLAVIAILAIVLLIAVPMVLNTIASSKMAAFKENAQMVIKTVDLKTASDPTFDYRTLNAGNITTKLGLDNSNYSSLSVTKQYGKTKVTIVGQGSWNGLTAYGTTDAMYATTVAPATLFADPLSGANPPELSSNMIPVYYDSTNLVWKKADVNNLVGTYSWYNYTNKIWANAVTVTDATRSTYQSAAVGTTITDADILTFMVWIPRYSYYITTSGTPTTSSIQIQFENASSPKSTGNATSTYLTHPAFTFGSQELSGIWVGKFEPSNTTSLIKIKPNMPSLTNQPVSAFYTAIRNMEATGNSYGYISSEVDTHMILNSEWGAVAYLTNSAYGKNSEVWINNNSTITTGCAGATVSAASVSGCVNTYNSTTGVNASTTGNVYGIYDMAGASWEYVMGNYNNYSGNTSGNGSGFSGYNPGDSSTTVGLSFPTSQYYNLYTTATTTTACSGGICYGHALSETAGWNGDSNNYFSGSYPWFVRGGDYSIGTGAGVFSYGFYGGSADGGVSTRIVQIES